ncbi:LuxR C-terminal-related transcriptional regulator [Desulfoluna butyratoxydans]|uniref:Transcription regulator luxr c-terminal n=1 Tax=Desulfoluna butyratoxydans TaxID=231438 RepID=A0A4U8YKJ7_9BACT|nr:LuxR C-terminal-related transcriptional regulator [Desulfoluna butyratoxydans]VFQ44406.1 transcription regulator luxr c-terminal [Desulfoluna butyratoxydans]
MDALLITKFHMPPLPDEAVPRPRLSNKLSPTTRVSLICAPAGFGKTSLAIAWLSRQTWPVAWLSLDANDNGAHRFFSYLMTALNRCVPGVASKSLGRLSSPSSPDLMAAMTQLINDLEQAGRHVVLALDDYHLIENQEIHAAVSFLINHQPHYLHLILISRTEPPLPIARLRSKNQLNEIRTEELRFNTDEARSFFNRSMCLGLTGEQIAKLEKQSEGWITGLQLAALSLREHLDANGFIDGMSGKDRHVADYLVSEVLAHQGPEIQNFLMQTSILKRFNADVCDDLLGIENSQQVLEQLERGNLFIVPLDSNRCWYRYHHWFAQMLSNRLRMCGRENVTRLHRQAASWFMAHSMWEEAIDHALEAKDYDRVITHLETHIDRILARGHFNIYLQWFKKVPEDYMPLTLTLHQLFFLYEMGEFEAFDQCLQSIEKQLDPLGEVKAGVTPEQRGVFLAIKGIRSASLFAVDEARDHFHGALDVLPEEKRFWRTLALGGYGFCQRVSGDPAAAIQIFRKAVSMAFNENLSFCFFMYSIALAKLYMEYGQLQRALETCRTLVDYQGADDGGVPFSGLAHVVMGQVYYHSGELLQSEKYLKHGLKKIIKDGDVFSIVDGYLVLALCLLDQGKPDEGIEAMDEMSASIDNLTPPDSVILMAASCKALIHTLTGKPASTKSGFLPQGGRDLAGKEYPDLSPLNFQGIYRTGQQPLTCYSNVIQLFAAKMAVETHRADESLSILTELISTFDDTTSLLFRADVLIQMALAHRRLGNDALAVESLKNAVGLVAPEHYYQIFMREGLPVCEMLKQVGSKLGPDNQEAACFIERMNEKAAEPSPSRKSRHASFDLTPRELEVLACLAKGANYAKTAAQLFVSVNTLKTHIKGIYGKLAVGNRTQAINKAKEFRLLPPS